MLLHIVRHGDPHYPTDSLTARGRAEAEALGERLSRRPLAALFTSPMGRARQTAEPTVRATGLTPTVLDWAAELSSPRIDDGTGSRQGVFWNVAGEYVRGGEVDPVAWSDFPLHAGPHHLGGDEEQVRFDIPGTVAAVNAGSDGFLADLGLERSDGIYRVTDSLPGEVVVFCHAGLGKTWLAHLLHLPVSLVWCGMFLATTSVTTVLFERRTDDRAVPRLLCLSDTSHLFASGLGENLRGLPIAEPAGEVYGLPVR